MFHQSLGNGHRSVFSSYNPSEQISSIKQMWEAFNTVHALKSQPSFAWDEENGACISLSVLRVRVFGLLMLQYEEH